MSQPRDTQASEARFLDHGDKISFEGRTQTVKSVRQRKSDRTINVKFISGDEHRFLWEDLVDVIARNTLPTAYGPRRSRYG